MTLVVLWLALVQIIARHRYQYSEELTRIHWEQIAR